MAAPKGTSEVRVWEVRGKELMPVATADGMRPARLLALSPDGRLLATAGKDRRVVLRDPATLQALLAFPDWTGPLQDVAAVSDTTKLTNVQKKCPLCDSSRYNACRPERRRSVL